MRNINESDSNDDNNDDKMKMVSTSTRKKRNPMSVPQFLQPINLTRLNIDLVLDWNKREASILESWMSFKKISKVKFRNKNNVFDSLDVELEMINTECTPLELVIDRLKSLNDNNAKELSEVFEKIFDPNYDWDYPNKYEYKNTNEYKEFLKIIENDKEKRTGLPYTVFYGRYDYNIKGMNINEVTFSKKLLEILYNENFDELYCDFLNQSSKFPFLCFIFDNKNYEYLNDVLKTLYIFPEFRSINYEIIVDLAKDELTRKKAEIKHEAFKFFDPLDPTKICEAITFFEFRLI